MVGLAGLAAHPDRVVARIDRDRAWRPAELFAVDEHRRALLTAFDDEGSEPLARRGREIGRSTSRLGAEDRALGRDVVLPHRLPIPPEPLEAHGDVEPHVIVGRELERATEALEREREVARCERLLAACEFRARGSASRRVGLSLRARGRRRHEDRDRERVG